MNENYRHQQLLNALDERKMLSTNEIIALLNVSPATARRDITKLSQQGRLKKIRNGAESLKQHFTFMPNNIDYINNVGEKQRIAEAAARLCQDGESVFLTCGSTMMMLGSCLCNRHLQIITNYLPLANYLINHHHEDLVIMGGQYHQNKEITLSLNQGEMTYAANIMFTSGKGFSTEGLFKSDMIIAHSERQMAAHSGKYVVLLDSFKLGQKAGMLFTELQDVDILITGREADPEIIRTLREKGLDVILA